MRTIIKAALALGIVGAAALATPSPSTAQVYYGGPGVSVYIGPPHYRHHRRYYRHRHYHRPRYYYRDYGYAPRRGRYYSTWNGCPHGFTVQDGVCKPYRGY